MKLGYVILYVTDVSQAMDFYANAFGLEKGFAHEGGDYGEMITGDTKLAFVSETLAASHGFGFRPQTRSEQAAAFEIALVTDDVAQAHARALANGAKELTQPQEMPWGQWLSYVSDHQGHTVEICSPVGA